MKATLSLSCREPCWWGAVTATCRPAGVLHVGGTEWKWMLDSCLLATVNHSPSHVGDVYFLWWPLWNDTFFLKTIWIMHLQHFIYTIDLIYILPTSSEVWGLYSEISELVVLMKYYLFVLSVQGQLVSFCKLPADPVHANTNTQMSTICIFISWWFICVTFFLWRR